MSRLLCICFANYCTKDTTLCLPLSKALAVQKIMCIKHTSKRLTEAFENKPYQGVDPNKAKFLFVGLDANYVKDIEVHHDFHKILEYHNDGAVFWEKYGVHHPFLLPTYSGSGKYYHSNFAKIGFTKKHANLVSFIELFHLPTTGRNKLKVSDLDVKHLNKLNNWITDGESECVFLSDGVIRLMKQSKCFPWLSSKQTIVENSGSLEVIKLLPSKTIYKHLHFSNYGKFRVRMNMEASEIKTLI